MTKRILNDSGAKFLRFCGPILDALRQLGGSGRPAEVEALILERGLISSAERLETIKDGSPRFHSQIHWARFYLAKAGYLAQSERGVWSLTEEGRKTHFTGADVAEMFHGVQSRWKAPRPVPSSGPRIPMPPSSGDGADEPSGPEEQHGPALIGLLRGLSPGGFEKLCQRLLREADFEQVKVTGRSGDGGIDGEGLLQINPFVSLRVMFQCKRYAGSVSPSHVRDFRGALAGRADKGVIITTGTFSSEATKEAVRDGATPIELVDGEGLVRLFERLRLGLSERTVYDINYDFFKEFG